MSRLQQHITVLETSCASKAKVRGRLAAIPKGATEALGTEHASTAGTYHWIGNVLNNQGKYEDAMQQKALGIKLKVVGAEHASTATTCHCIGIVLQDHGKYEDALQQFPKALEIKLKVVGVEHVSTATSYHCLGIVLQDQDKYEGAVQQYRTVLQIRLKSLGPEDHLTISTHLAIERCKNELYSGDTNVGKI